VLIVALVLAILYFMLMALIMIDSSRAQAEAQRFRARIMAATLAENGAEMACTKMTENASGYVSKQDQDGIVIGTYRRGAEGELTGFEVTGEGTTAGAMKQKAWVRLEGTIDKSGQVRIEWSRHSQ
jgi:Tfp pilus assembly protein PilV